AAGRHPQCANRSTRVKRRRPGRYREAGDFGSIGAHGRASSAGGGDPGHLAADLGAPVEGLPNGGGDGVMRQVKAETGERRRQERRKTICSVYFWWDEAAGREARGTLLDESEGGF